MFILYMPNDSKGQIGRFLVSIYGEVCDRVKLSNNFVSLHEYLLRIKELLCLDL